MLQLKTKKRPPAPAISTEVAAAERELRKEIEGQAYSQCFLLTDRSLREIDVTVPGWERYAEAPHCAVPLEGARLSQEHWPRLTLLRPQETADVAFLLKSVDDAYHELWQERLREGQGRCIGGWLMSSAPLEVVASHLGSVMTQRHPSGKKVWLRLQDPAVIWAVGHLLTDPQRNAFLGPIEHFYFFDPVGQLVDMAHGQVPPEESLLITDDQWISIECVKAINMALRDWRELVLSEQLDPAFRAAFRAIRRAREMGFKDDKDLALYGLLAITVHPLFDFHPLVIARLKVRQPSDYFSGLVADLGEEAWQRIGQEAPPADTS